MIKRFTIVVVAMLFLGLSQSVKAQDPEFTQFYANPLYLNPAFAGSARCPRICLNYRNEWPAISGTFVTYSASYDQAVDALSGGLGLLVTSDQAGQGTINTTNFSGIYAYQLNVTREFSIRVGFQATYEEKSIDWSKLTFGDMIDPTRGFVYTTHTVPGANSINNVDFSTGILGFSKTYFFGFAVDHLTQPNESFLQGANVSPLPMKFTGHAGAIIPVGNDLGSGNQAFISPNILFQKQQD
ncbi:MAG TPA: PorP/SprF family type IX secretion system membrane protein, partial [Bacteroidia bacterium]|nr:PorP/SprF family type IX secretion system membrane protein [Bacteroidia bacterium]